MLPVNHRPQRAYPAIFPIAVFRSRVKLRGLSSPVFRLALSLLIGVSPALPALAEEALGFEQALHLAQERSQQLIAQERAASAARDMAVAAGQRPDPTLKLGVNNLPIDSPDRFSLSRDFMTMRSVGVMQEFTREDKRLARSKRFEQEAQASEAGRALILANLQRDTATAWLNCFYLGHMLDLLGKQRDEANLQIDAADAAYRGGKGAQVDVFAARALVAQIEDRLDQARRSLAAARTQLDRWVGNSPRDFSLLISPPDTSHLPGHHADSSDIVQRHPELVLMARQEDMAQAEVEGARANMQADWSAELMLSHRGPAYSNMVSLNVSVPLQWDPANRQDRELAAKLALADQMRAQREEATREHLAQIQTMQLEWQSSRARLARYDSTLMPLAAQRTQAALTAYRAGTGTLTSVLDARRAAIDVQMERLRLEMDAAQVWAQLTYLIPADHDVAAAQP
ncbi:TolC family protein [Aquabacterium sp.]|uniref:TolC family protein n=1 Tax=Aquabacterium sp. TaxID=1872578 RepID=UPI0035AEFA9D